MAHTFINEIEPGTEINDIYLVNSPVLRSTTRGDLYIAMYLADKTGQVNSRMWQATESLYKSLPQTGFVRIQGRSELYKNNLQIIINNVSVIQQEQVSLDDFLARTEKDTEKMFEELKSSLAKIKNPQLKRLIDACLGDNDLMSRFCEAPAATRMHHNYLGGLLEHTHNMQNVALRILPFYKDVQPDLVLAGIFLHDIGKTRELSYGMGLGYTNAGQLLGHIVQGVLIVNRKAEQLAEDGEKIDQEILDSLIHIILSHHSQYEFGSPKLPATPEAFMVSILDDLDAKITQVASAIEDAPENTDWTPWKKSLQRRLYRKKID